MSEEQTASEEGQVSDLSEDLKAVLIAKVGELAKDLLPLIYAPLNEGIQQYMESVEERFLNKQHANAACYNIRRKPSPDYEKRKEDNEILRLPMCYICGAQPKPVGGGALSCSNPECLWHKVKFPAKVWVGMQEKVAPTKREGRIVMSMDGKPSQEGMTHGQFEHEMSKYRNDIQDLKIAVSLLTQSGPAPDKTQELEIGEPEEAPPEKDAIQEKVEEDLTS